MIDVKSADVAGSVTSRRASITRWVEDQWRRGTAGHQAAAAALAALGVGALLRFYGLGWQSLWFDEAFSWGMVQFPWIDIVRRTAEDVHPPLYYFVLKLWVGLFGDSAFAMRSLSAALDLLCLPLLYGFVIDLDRLSCGRPDNQASGSAKWGAALATAFAALSVFRVVLAREARMYPLGCLLTIASSWALWRALYSREGRLWSWTGYVLSAVGLCYTHNYGTFTVAAQAAFAFGVVARGWWPTRNISVARFSEVVAAFFAVALGFAPWLPTLLWQRGRVAQGYWISGLTPEAVHGLFEQWFTPKRDIHLPVTGGAVTLAFAAVMMAYGWRLRAAKVYVLLLALTPLALGLGLSLIQGRNVIIGIYLAFAFPFVLIAVADLVQRIPVPAARTGVSLLLIANMTFQDWYCWDQADVAHRPGMRHVAEFVREQFRPGDLVLSLEPQTMLVARFYFRPTIKPLYVPDGDVSRDLKGQAVLVDSEMISVAQLRREPPRRVWLISGTALHRRRVLPEEWKLKSYWTFPDAAPRRREVAVRLFDVPNQ